DRSEARGRGALDSAANRDPVAAGPEVEQRHVGLRGEERLGGIGDALRLDHGPEVGKRPPDLGAERLVSGDEQAGCWSCHLAETLTRGPARRGRIRLSPPTVTCPHEWRPQLPSPTHDDPSG